MSAEKSPLTSGNDHEQGFDSSKIGGTTRVVPALVEQPGTVVATSLEGPDMHDDSGKRHPAPPWRHAILADGERWPLNTLPSTARLVACALAEHVDWRGQAYPGAAALARRTGLSERSIRSNLDLLAAAGWLDETERGGQPGGRRTTLWTILTPALPAGVTPERAAGVDALTPEPHAPTPADETRTPAAAAPEQEELDEQEGGAATVEGLTVWAAARIRLHPEEAGDAIAAAVDRHGLAAVLAAKPRLLGRTFTHASHLRTAIANAVEQRPTRPALRAVADLPSCSECRGTGLTYEPGSNTVTTCSCRTASAGAS